MLPFGDAYRDETQVLHLNPAVEIDVHIESFQIGSESFQYVVIAPVKYNFEKRDVRLGAHRPYPL